MSLEQAIQALTAAVTTNNELLLRSMQSTVATAITAAPVAVQPVQPVQPVQQPAQPAAVTGMPAAPTFGFPTQAQQPAQPAAPVAPFSTQQELFNYTGAAYQAMGPEKGGKIQGILQTMGLTNLNDVKPEQYGNFYALVEQLKVSV